MSHAADRSKPVEAGTSGAIRVGVGGWTYEPWRGSFFPAGLVQKRELEFASRQLTSIEINGTFYGSQRPESFARWHDETPDDFVFALKGPRFATNRRVLAEAGASVERFFASGVLNLKDKLGPVNWQLPPHKHFDAADVEAFLKLLPMRAEGRRLRHALEVRHDSFLTPEFVALAREYGAAIVLAADARYPQIADLSADFVYARVMGTREDEPDGYPAAELDAWAERARRWGAGESGNGLQTVSEVPPEPGPRDVFLFIISGFKLRNPAAAMALIRRLGPAPPDG